MFKHTLLFCARPFFSRLVSILQGHGTDHLKVWESNFKVKEMSENSRMYMYRAIWQSAIWLSRTSKGPSESSAN